MVSYFHAEEAGNFAQVERLENGYLKGAPKFGGFRSSWSS